MKKPFRETWLTSTQRSKEMLVGLTKKTQTLFALSPEQKNAEGIEIVDPGTQRLAQTQFGRLLLRWSKPQKKRKKKRRFPLVTVIFLALFALMVAISFLGNHQAAAAASAAPASVAAASAPASATNKTLPIDTTPTPAPPDNLNKCPDQDPLDANGQCAPDQFDVRSCADQGDTNSPSSDPCNPWGDRSNYNGVDKDNLAAEWEELAYGDQLCIEMNGEGVAGGIIDDLPNKPPKDGNSDLSWRGSVGSGQININGLELKLTCTKSQGGVFPCAQDEPTIATDWLSGEPGTTTLNTNPVDSGHLLTTYDSDTLTKGSVKKVYSYTLWLAFALLAPIVAITGYKLLISGSTFRHAEALAIIPRIFMAVAAIVICYYLIGLLIDLSNDASTTVVALHNALPYPASTTVKDNGGVSFYIGYTLAVGSGNTADSSTGDGTILLNEPNDSYRGIVTPIDRWGCAANDFVSILTTSFWTNVFASIIPFFGSFISLTEKVTSAIAVVHHLGEFIATILSIGLAGQTIFRIIMINFYILTGPIACACWGLPGGTGQGIFGQWLKGLLSLLFTQAAQIFILSVTPLIIPNLSQAGIPTDSMHLLTSIFSALPTIIVLFITLQVPKFIGTSATKAVASAGMMASGAVAAGAAAAYSVTQ